MRLWHYQLIKDLSRNHILGQWRECLAITGAIAKHGQVNHATVNRLNDYPIEHLQVYIQLVKDEMGRRGYRVTEKSHQKLINDIAFDWDQPVSYTQNQDGVVTLPDGQNLFAGFHDRRYWLQNLYMMQEKYDTQQIEAEVWQDMIRDYPGDEFS
ncbi:pyrimidine dimer DNA glycosylase/endonuclease V, partial [Fructobacillus ficulneus]